MSYRLGVDVGGTFTDLLLINEETGETFRAKIPTTPANQAAAEPMAQALREAASWVGCDDVRLERVEPAPWAPRLAAALAELS